MKNEDELTERALKAYLRRANADGQTCQQPNSALSGRDGDIVTLANCHGPLARYQVHRDKTGAESLRFLD